MQIHASEPFETGAATHALILARKSLGSSNGLTSLLKVFKLLSAYVKLAQ